MDRKHIHIISRCHRLVSMLLVALFILISVLQVLHVHRSSITDEGPGKSEVIYASNKCTICDYFVHKQSKHLHFSHPAELPEPVITPITFNSEAYIGNYAFTLQGFTNKGPPCFTSQI